MQEKIMECKIKNCSFTGHRVILPEHIALVKDRLKRGINYAYEKGCRNFFCGGALGFDTMAAREVILYRLSHKDVRLFLVLPCLNQSENWNEKQKDAYDFIASSADEIIYTSEEYTKDCMRVRNEYLAKSCDILIAYLTRSVSGAGQTVRIAKRLGKEVHNISPAPSLV